MKKLYMLLSLLIALTSFSTVYGMQQNQKSNLSFNLNLSFNNSIMSEDTSDKVILGKESLESAELSIHLEDILERAEAHGVLKLNEDEYQIVAEGQLNEFDVLDQKDFAKGVFTGYIYKDHQVVDEVIFDLEYDTKEMKYVASSMTIGLIKENMEAQPITLSFGAIDEKLNKAYYEKYVFGKNNKETITSSNISTKSIVPDYTLRTYDTFNSSFGDIMYVAGYHPSIIGDHENASMYVKTWTNKENIGNYMANYHNTLIVPNSVAVYKLEFEILNEMYWEADDPTPSDGDNSFNMPLPIYIGGLGYQLITVPITTNYTDFTASGSPNENNASWTLEKYFGYFHSTDAQSSSPWYDDDDYGMGGKVNFSYQANTSNNIQTDITFNGTYYCSAVADEGTYITKYLSFYHDTDSTITITP